MKYPQSRSETKNKTFECVSLLFLEVSSVALREVKKNKYVLLCVLKYIPGICFYLECIWRKFFCTLFTISNPQMCKESIGKIVTYMIITVLMFLFSKIVINEL